MSRVVEVRAWPSRLDTVRRSIPAVRSSVATKWRSPWSLTCSSPARLRSRSHRRETKFGRHGVFALASLVKMRSSAVTMRPTSAAFASAPMRRAVSERIARAVSDTSLNRSVLVVLMCTPACLVAATERSMRTVARSRSTSLHRRAQILPRRAPVAVAMSSQHDSVGSVCSAIARRRRTPTSDARGESSCVSLTSGGILLGRACFES